MFQHEEHGFKDGRSSCRGIQMRNLHNILLSYSLCVLKKKKLT